MNISDKLFALQDMGYKDFNCKLIPNINPDTVIGVRVPALKQCAKELFGAGEYNCFICSLPHKYFEENNLHAYLINQIKDFDLCIYEINKFLPFVDNWATCDGLRPVSFKNNKKQLINHINGWLNSQHTYTVRFAIEMLMTHFLDDDFDELYIKKVSEIESEEYYVNMMIAWYFATALAKQWDSSIKYIENKNLSTWVHNKTIQKACESYRLNVEQKEYLRKIKNA